MHPDRRAIQSLADEVDRLHDESLRTLRNDPSRPPTDGRFTGLVDPGCDSRRSFLKKVGIGGAALTVGGTMLPINGLVPMAGAQEGDDESDDAAAGGSDGLAGREQIAFVQSFELAAAAAYGIATDRLAGFGNAELRTLADTFGDHHQQYADALGTNVLVLTEEQQGEVRENAELLNEFRTSIGRAGDARAVAQVLRTLEERAAATYLALMDVLTDPADAKAVALTLPVAAQRAVVWGTELELEPADFMLTFQADSDATSFAPSSS